MGVTATAITARVARITRRPVKQTRRARAGYARQRRGWHARHADAVSVCRTAPARWITLIRRCFLSATEGCRSGGAQVCMHSCRRIRQLPWQPSFSRQPWSCCCCCCCCQTTGESGTSFDVPDVTTWELSVD